MRRSLCLLLALVCLASLPCALGEEAAEGTLQTSAALSDMEQVIDPVYPVPDYVEWLLDVARGELGYKEQSGGVTKYGAWAGDPAAEWCAEFLCWCVDQVDKQMATHLLTQQYPYYTGNNTGRDWFLKKGRYVARTGTVPGWGAQWYPGDTALMEKNSYVPQPGDWVFFSTNCSTASGFLKPNRVRYSRRPGIFVTANTDRGITAAKAAAATNRGSTLERLGFMARAF